ncbi:MAG: PfaD family polyunsaturated fatty acid/polyketide biosynthesis protein [Anaerolineae bacterium]|nr:PfaD family polyunsaturated fatty acid/polyketide biosynthesis protein [Anaerolineae bacterium]
MTALINRTPNPLTLQWRGPVDSLAHDEEGMRACLLRLERPVWAVQDGERPGLSNEGAFQESSSSDGAGRPALAYAPPLPLEMLGDPAFCDWHGARYAYYIGSMANGLSSEEMVIAAGKAGMLASFGAAGLTPPRIEAAIDKIKSALPNGPYAFNLINSPNEPALEARAADLYLKHGIRTVEASAYLILTAPLVLYRAAGLSLGRDGRVVIGNKIIAKLSRREVAQQFMEPAPAEIINQLLQEKRITEEQARLSQQVPMADDITAEADSGGHTDNRPLVCLLPSILALRDEIQAQRGYAQPVRVGAAGGIGTPASALAAWSMGAAYIATGSVNQPCIESGASPHTKNLLAQAGMADVMMAPSADMFEMGVKVQLLKRGTLFPLRAQKLYEVYSRYTSIEEIPPEEREKLEKTIFRRNLDEIWQDTVQFFRERDPSQIERAEKDPHQKMALVFRWYLGLSSRWSIAGEKGREMDYQIWCGPAMGAFNEWVQGAYLAATENRSVVDIGLHILTGSAYLARLRTLVFSGVRLPASLEHYTPRQPLVVPALA